MLSIRKVNKEYNGNAFIAKRQSEKKHFQWRRKGGIAAMLKRKGN